MVNVTETTDTRNSRDTGQTRHAISGQSWVHTTDHGLADGERVQSIDARESANGFQRKASVSGFNHFIAGDFDNVHTSGGHDEEG